LEGNDVLIRMKEVVFAYDGGRVVLDGASFELRRGERVGLVGHIGTGKTTILHLIVGLLRPRSGLIEVFGRARSEERDFLDVRLRAGLLFQDPEDQLFCPTVIEDTAFGPLNQGKSRVEAAAVSREVLGMLGLDGFEDRITHHLSGGEKRLVSLATVLAMKPDLLLLDEPVTGLDPESAERITAILHTLPQAMLIVSHDQAFLRSVTSRSIRVEGGKLEPAVFD
jgi:cobalt/nickel transport system ATP-binding protein